MNGTNLLELSIICFIDQALSNKYIIGSFDSEVKVFSSLSTYFIFKEETNQVLVYFYSFGVIFVKRVIAWNLQHSRQLIRPRNGTKSLDGSRQSER